jgi:nucleoid-associated protein YgaU
MTDVEKYGLFAVVLVGGLLLVVALQGGFSGGEPKAVAEDVLPVVMDAPRQIAGADGKTKVVRVKSILPDKPFQWDEAPAPYPGERSSNGPATVKPIAGGGAAAGSAGSKWTSGTHTVVAGETLSDIAAKELGSPNQWDEIVKLNPGLNPKKLQIGQVLRVSGAPSASTVAGASVPTAPPLKTAEPAPKAAEPTPKVAEKAADKPPATPKVRTHTVATGDTLSSIAKKYLGSTTRADDIFAVNRDVLKSKDELKLGQVLKIP